VIGKHALRNALIATITILAINIGYLISGSVVIENVFGIPGLGSLSSRRSRCATSRRSRR
jgi:ABC-type dipeptide/oligopeptide/nickel transport system permease component